MVKLKKANLLKKKQVSSKKHLSPSYDLLDGQTSDALNELLYKIPNVPHESVPQETR